MGAMATAVKTVVKQMILTILDCCDILSKELLMSKLHKLQYNFSLLLLAIPSAINVLVRTVTGLNIGQASVSRVMMDVSRSIFYPY